MLKSLLGIPDRRVEVQSIDELVDALIALEHRYLDLNKKTSRPQIKNTEDCIRRMIQMVTFQPVLLSDGKTIEQSDVFLSGLEAIRDDLSVLLQDYFEKMRPGRIRVEHHAIQLLRNFNSPDSDWKSDLKKLNGRQIYQFIFNLVEALRC